MQTGAQLGHLLVDAVLKAREGEDDDDDEDGVARGDDKSGDASGARAAAPPSPAAAAGPKRVSPAEPDMATVVDGSTPRKISPHVASAAPSSATPTRAVMSAGSDGAGAQEEAENQQRRQPSNSYRAADITALATNTGTGTGTGAGMVQGVTERYELPAGSRRCGRPIGMVVEAVRELYGGVIDLDPCGDTQSQALVRMNE